MGNGCEVPGKGDTKDRVRVGVRVRVGAVKCPAEASLMNCTCTLATNTVTRRWMSAKALIRPLVGSWQARLG